MVRALTHLDAPASPLPYLRTVSCLPSRPLSNASPANVFDCQQRQKPPFPAVQEACEAHCIVGGPLRGQKIRDVRRTLKDLMRDLEQR